MKYLRQEPVRRAEGKDGANMKLNILTQGNVPSEE